MSKSPQLSDFPSNIEALLIVRECQSKTTAACVETNNLLKGDSPSNMSRQHALTEKRSVLRDFSPLQTVMEEARAKQAASMTELPWQGRRLPVRNEKTRVCILRGESSLAATLGPVRVSKTLAINASGVWIVMLRSTTSGCLVLETMLW